MGEADADVCQWLTDKVARTICGKPAVTGIDHPLYNAALARVCAEHEPDRHDGDGCGGHILGGECHCY